jgi:hypothetical protein
MKPNLSAARAAQPLALTLAVLMLAGCGSGAASLAADRAASPSNTSSAAPEPAAATPSAVPTDTSTPSAVPTATSTPSATATGASAADVTAAAKAALGLFEKVPRNSNDPAAGYLWGPVSDLTGHLSRDIVARLAALHSSGFFSDRVCPVDYFTGTQQLLEAAPTVVSAHGNAGGTVTVVIRRPVTPARPDLTLVMTQREGVWLATQLASGSGPSASIFAAKPNC